MIAIIDYGMGNLYSIQKAFHYLGYDAVLTDRPDVLEQASHVVLPGVGAFADAAKQLHRAGLFDEIKRQIAGGKPFLGVCLGMQLLFCSSVEGGRETPGLCVFPEKIIRFSHGEIVPHMGWNAVSGGDEILFGSGTGREYVYFVHSYYCPDSKAMEPYTAARCDYGISFCAAARRENCIGVQFHPEKSGQAGLEMLGRFARWSGGQ